MLKIALIREGKTPPDERVPLAPEQAKKVEESFKDVKVIVQSSEVRRFKDEEYAKQGLEIREDISDADVFLGVKEVPKKDLIAGKTYFFFSHTIKKQPYNRELLQEVLKRRITLIDYECLTEPSGMRLIGFGRYAGIVGTYNTLRAHGLRTGLFDLKPAYLCEDQEELKEELKKFNYSKENPPRIVLTGNGRVAHGAMEVLEFLNINKVDTRSFLLQTFDQPVFCQLKVTDYNKRKDGREGSIQEFFSDPEPYESDFMRFAKVANVYLACHFWKEGSPFIFSRADAKQPDFNIEIVGDISCDIDGPVASTLRPSTIKDPLYGYDPKTEREVLFDTEGSIGVMAVDNLPCELPKDASRDFGEELLKRILPALLSDDEEGIIKRGTIASNGSLTEYFRYLSDYAQGLE